MAIQDPCWIKLKEMVPNKPKIVKNGQKMHMEQTLNPLTILEWNERAEYLYQLVS